MIRRLAPPDAEVYVALRGEALLEAPLAFGSSPGDDGGSSVELMRANFADPTQATFGAFEPHLVGIVGLQRERQVKRVHKSTLWGLYVAPSHRRLGIARALMEVAIAFARSLPGVERVHLGVGDWNVGAKRLYEDLGFVVWGTEVDALRVGGATVIELHMVLVL